MTGVWYHVRDLEAARRFYKDRLRFVETYFDGDGGWSRLVRGAMEIGLAEGEPQPDRWPLTGELRELAARWAIEPERELSHVT